MSGFAKRYPGESGRRQPVHTVYGGAHLFKSDTAARLGQLAVRSFDTFAPDAGIFAKALDLPPKLADTIFARVGEKIAREAVEDFRIDFEDGYGTRPDAEEDGHAVAAAEEVAKGMAAGTLSPFIGIRIKTFSEELMKRSIRTLDLFLTTLTERSGGKLPDNFVVTLPKIVTPEQVGLLVDIFDGIEPKLGLAAGSLKMEMMIETTQSIIASNGEIGMPKMLAAARGRCTAAHFGTYDYTASCSITAAYQDMLHPACDFARSMMQVAFGGTGVWLSDGATNIMPVAPHRGDGSHRRSRSPKTTRPSTARGSCITTTAAIRWRMLFTKAGTCTRDNCRRDTPRCLPSFLKGSMPPANACETLSRKPRKRRSSAMFLMTRRPARDC